MKYDEFIQRLQYYSEQRSMFFSPHKISREQIPALEAIIQASFGPEMCDFLTGLGSLVFYGFETYGINASFPFESSALVKTTNMLHQYYPATKGLIVIAYEDEDAYYVVDSQDHVFAFYEDENALLPTGMDLFEFLLFMLEESLKFSESIIEDEE